ncbi:MAG: glycosyltransferase family 4 protein [Nanoarchaeota archaeon]|nr:glycosyltransferase family 4 protein [Nanoarchaeota archaeon]
MIKDKNFLLLFPYPSEPDGQSLQGNLLLKGMLDLGYKVFPCDRANNEQKWWAYEHYKPDIVIGTGYWGDTPDLITDTLEHGFQPVPWLNADGWVANYHDILNKLPLLLVTSKWVKETYERDGVKGEHIQVAHIGFDPLVFYPVPENDSSRLHLRKLLGVEEDEKMILIIGGDVTSKGAQEMLKALAKIDKEFPKWKLVFKVWDSFSAKNHGKEESQLIKELELPEEKIKYLEGKFAPEFIAALLNACDIYAAPSRLEGFGMIQVEAQACGKPVISINAGGPADTIVHGKTGYLVDVGEEIQLVSEWALPRHGFAKKQMIYFDQPKTFAYRANIDQLAECVLKLLKDDELRKEMGKAAAKHALDNFHYIKTTQDLLNIIEKNIFSKEIKLELSSS